MILFCAADQGPSKYLAEVISIFPGESCYVGGKSSTHIFEQTKALPFAKGVEKDVRLVVTGTSLGNENTSLDKQFIRWTKTHNLPSVAVIEHWSWYRKRFEVEEGKLLLPDYILVNDQIAFQAAILDGLSAAILRVVGN